ncbi:hypothetical protein [Phenylobacterium sp.]|uniref:hypothetical protein n=1 Tax=Phenylobacterium sp. TaxID=1871053 RepID=UPI0035C7AC75
MTTIHPGRKGARTFLIGAVAAIMLSACQPRASEGQSQTVDGFKLDYGVVPSAVVGQHPSDHPESAMHQGPPKDSYHITLAVSDAKTQGRVEDAEVTVKVAGHGHPGNVALPMELMTIAGSPTYGRYVSLPSPGRYQLTFEVAPAGRRHDPVKAQFAYDRPD